jgi:triphosphatase
MTETVRRSLVADPVIEIGNTAYPVITPDSTVGTGLQLMLTAGVRTLRNATHRGESERPEALHRFRVGVRRLRSFLSAFRKVLPDEERRLLGKRLGSIAKRYSRAREWDVFLATTLRPMSEALPDEPALLELEACVKEARRRALPEVVNFPAETASIPTAIDAAAWLRQPQPEFADDWRSDLKGFASSLLTKRHRRLRKHLKTVDLEEQDSFHALRIQAKKIRYPIEMFENLFDEKATGAYLERLIAVQDALGHLNDALVARQLLTELPLSSRAQGLANGWLAREIVVRRNRFPAATKKLRKAAPFWED